MPPPPRDPCMPDATADPSSVPRSSSLPNAASLVVWPIPPCAVPSALPLAWSMQSLPRSPLPTLLTPLPMVAECCQPAAACRLALAAPSPCPAARHCQSQSRDCRCSSPIVERAMPVVPTGASKDADALPLAEPSAWPVSMPTLLPFASPKSVRRVAVLKAAIGIRKSRRCMCRIWRRVFQVF